MMRRSLRAAVLVAGLAMTSTAAAFPSSASAAISAASGTTLATPKSTTYVQCKTGVPGFVSPAMTIQTFADTNPGYAVQNFRTRVRVFKWVGGQWVFRNQWMAFDGLTGTTPSTVTDWPVGASGYYAIAVETWWLSTGSYAYRWADSYAESRQRNGTLITNWDNVSYCTF